MATVQLMIYAEHSAPVHDTNFGGKPLANADLRMQWPRCKSCDLPMQYLFRIATDRGMNLVFMCQNDPGMCDDWDANSGGNKVLRFRPDDLVEMEVPSGGETMRPVEHAVVLEGCEADNYEEAREKWCRVPGRRGRLILGQMYGEPCWIQGNETPKCDHCGMPMRHVAQIEQGADHSTEMNFGGGGCAYLFDCACEGSAKFLWQC